MPHSVRIPDWAVARGLRMNHFPRLDPMKTALLVIDMQRYFIDPDQPLANAFAKSIIPNVNRIVSAMRDAGVPIFWVRHTNAREGAGALPAWKMAMPLIALGLDALIPGAPGHDLHPELDHAPGDEIVDKYRYSCFIQGSSDLQERLDARGIEAIVVVGTLTNGCCESTVRDGSMLGYKVVAVSDAMAAITDEEQAASLLSMRIGFADVISADELLERIAAL